MTQITGKVTAITLKEFGSVKCNILNVEYGSNENGYFECRNTLKEISDSLEVGDMIKLTYVIKAKVSNSGQYYNNLIAMAIDKAQ